MLPGEGDDVVKEWEEGETKTESERKPTKAAEGEKAGGEREGKKEMAEGVRKEIGEKAAAEREEGEEGDVEGKKQHRRQQEKGENRRKKFKGKEWRRRQKRISQNISEPVRASEESRIMTLFILNLKVCLSTHLR